MMLELNFFGVTLNFAVQSNQSTRLSVFAHNFAVLRVLIVFHIIRNYVILIGLEKWLYFANVAVLIYCNMFKNLTII